MQLLAELSTLHSCRLKSSLVWMKESTYMRLTNKYKLNRAILKQYKDSPKSFKTVLYALMLFFMLDAFWLTCFGISIDLHNIAEKASCHQCSRTCKQAKMNVVKLLRYSSSIAIFGDIKIIWHVVIDFLLYIYQCDDCNNWKHKKKKIFKASVIVLSSLCGPVFKYLGKWQLMRIQFEKANILEMVQLRSCLHHVSA